MEKKKTKKQKKDVRKIYLVIIAIIVVALGIVLIVNKKVNTKEETLASALEIKQLAKYIENLDYNSIYSYETFDEEAKIDYSIRRCISDESDEFSFEDFKKYYKSKFGELNLDEAGFKDKYSYMLINNGIIYNPAEEKYVIEERREVENTENIETPINIKSKRIIEKATKDGNVYTIYVKNIRIIDEITYKEFLTQNYSDEYKMDSMQDVDLLSTINKDNYHLLPVNIVTEVVKVDTTDQDKFLLLDFTTTSEDSNV